MLAQIYTAGGIMRIESLIKENGDSNSIGGLVVRGYVEVWDGLVSMSDKAWALYPPEPGIRPEGEAA